MGPPASLQSTFQLQITTKLAKSEMRMIQKREKALSLHSALTLAEATDWINFHSSEKWSVSALIGRLRDWCSARDGRRLLTPDVLKVVLRAGTALVDPATGVRRVLERPITAEIGGHYVETFLEGLHEHGEAHAVTVVFGNCRWRVESVLSEDVLRLTPAQVDSLVTPFDRLLQLEVQATSPYVAVDQTSSSDPTSDERPEKRSVQQTNAILSALRELGLEPAKLPVPPVGRRGPKVDVRKYLLQNGGEKLFPGLNPNNHCKAFMLSWEVLRGEGKIAGIAK